MSYDWSSRGLLLWESTFYQQFSVLRSSEFIFPLRRCLFYFMFVSPLFCSRSASHFSAHRCPFTSSLWLRAFLMRFYTHPHAHNVHAKAHKSRAGEGSGKVRYSDEVWSKNTSCFPGKAASKKSACLLSYHLTSVGRRELLTVVVFPLAEHADLWKQSLHTQTEAITLGEPTEQDLTKQLCALFISSFADFHCVWELMRIEGYSERRVKDPWARQHLHQLRDRLHGLLLSDRCRYIRQRCSDLLPLISCAAFSPPSGNRNHRNRQYQALCDLFVSVFSFHICWSYSKPRVSFHSLEMKTLAGINL